VTGERPARVGAVVDHDLCAGVAQCVQIAPGAFRLDDEGLSVAVATGPFTAQEVADTADACPMAAITLTRQSTT
jgi:ferredoxin